MEKILTECTYVSEGKKERGGSEGCSFRAGLASSEGSPRARAWLGSWERGWLQQRAAGAFRARRRCGR